jgi:hypothetical protein
MLRSLQEPRVPFIRVVTDRIDLISTRASIENQTTTGTPEQPVRSASGLFAL